MKLHSLFAVVFVLLLAILFSVPARAQETRETIFIAPGGISSNGATARTYQVGGGIERMLEHGVGASSDIAAVMPGEGKFSNTTGLFALDLNYHRKVGRAEPFAAAGYSLLFRDFTANMFNFGGGISYWFAPDRGLRLEFRDNVGSPQNGAHAHYWAFRLGFNFR